MTAKIEVGTSWTVIFPHYTGEKQVPAGKQEQPIQVNPYDDVDDKPNHVTLTYGEDLIAKVTAFPHYTGVNVCTYLEDGTEQFKHNFAKGLVELDGNKPAGYCERGGSAFGVRDYYYLKEEGSVVGFGKLADSSYLKITHEVSPPKSLTKMGEIIP